VKKTKQITADNRPICKNCYHCRAVSGANVKACHWSLDNDTCKPFKPEMHSCEGFKVKGDRVRSAGVVFTAEERELIRQEQLRIAECERYAKRLIGNNRAQGGAR